MLARLLTAVVLAAPARAAVLEIAPAALAAEVRLAPAPALALAPATAPSAAYAALPLAPTLAALFAAAPAAAVPAPAAAAALPDVAPAAAVAILPAGAPAAPRRRETIQEVSARMRADAERLGRAFKTIAEWQEFYGDRDSGKIHGAGAGPDGRALLYSPYSVHRIPEGKMLPYVLTADGSLDVGMPTDERETGVKHLQIAAGRKVVFAGEIGRRNGRLVIDLNSGTFSYYGMDPRWAYTPQNVALLKDYASALLGEPVEVVVHLDHN